MTAVALSSCRQEADDLESQMFVQTNGTSLMNCFPQTYTEQFDVLWNGINQNYVAWQIEDYDWDEVYRTKRSVPQAWDERVNANPNDTISDEEFKKFYQEILSPLSDSHFVAFLWNLRTKSNTQQFIFPGKIRLWNRETSDPYEPLAVLQDKCMDEGTSLWEYTLESYNKRGHLVPIKVTTSEGKEEESPFIIFNHPEAELQAELAVIKTANGKYVPYLHWSRFRFSLFLKQEKKADSLYLDGTASKFLKTYGDVVKKYGEAGLLGGVILDVRNNGGGSAGDYTHLLGRLLEPGSKVILGNIVKKNGVGRLDYGPSTPYGFQIYDYNQYVVKKEPIVVLCDGRSVSMSEQTAFTAKLLPNGHVIGDRTFGGFNFLDQTYDLTYSGSFGDDKNGPVYVYTPSLLTLPIDGSKLESVGVMPDEYIPYDEKIVNDIIGDLDNIKDAHIEAAIKYIEGK